MRKEMTREEFILWSYIKNKQFLGLKFRRQVPIDGKYIADFLCFEPMVIIELDASQHGMPENIEKDNQRTSDLELLGYKVLRVWNDELLKNEYGVFRFLLNEIEPLL